MILKILLMMAVTLATIKTAKSIDVSTTNVSAMKFINGTVMMESHVDKILKVNSRKLCPCWTQCKLNTNCTAVSIIPNTGVEEGITCHFTGVESKEVMAELVEQTGTVTLIDASASDEITATTTTTEKITTKTATPTAIEIPEDVYYFNSGTSFDTESQCDYHVIESNQVSNTFRLYECQLDFKSSGEKCERLQGKLASLSDTQTYDKIKQILDDDFKSLVNIWVNVAKRSTYLYVWGDGEILPGKGEKPWHNARPNHWDKCARLLVKNGNYGMDDVDCAAEYAFLCKM